MRADPNNVGDRMVAGLISTIILTPVQLVFPYLFKSINKFRSLTIIRIERLQKLERKKARRRKCAWLSDLS
jgi:hypothetical protein